MTIPVRHKVIILVSLVLATGGLYTIYERVTGTPVINLSSVAHAAESGGGHESGGGSSGGGHESGGGSSGGGHESGGGSSGGGHESGGGGSGGGHESGGGGSGGGHEGGGGSGGGHEGGGGSGGGHDSGGHGTKAKHQGHGSGQHGGASKGGAGGSGRFGGGTGTSGDTLVPEGPGRHGKGFAETNENDKGRTRYMGGRNVPEPPVDPTDPPIPPITPVPTAEQIAGPGGGPSDNFKTALESAGRCDGVGPKMSTAQQLSVTNLTRLNAAHGVVDPSISGNAKPAASTLIASLQSELVKSDVDTDLAGTYLGLLAKTPVSAGTVRKMSFELCAKVSDDKATKIANVAEQQRASLMVAQVNSPTSVASEASMSMEAKQKIGSLPWMSLFAFNQSALGPQAKADLDNEIVSRRKELTVETAVIVSGHADRIGSASYNQKLSERRAQSVKTYLIGKGVPADIIAAQGFGESQPVSSPEVVSCVGIRERARLIECLQPNRRVEVLLKEKNGKASAAQSSIQSASINKH